MRLPSKRAYYVSGSFTQQEYQERRRPSLVDFTAEISADLAGVIGAGGR